MGAKKRQGKRKTERERDREKKSTCENKISKKGSNDEEKERN